MTGYHLDAWVTLRCTRHFLDVGIMATVEGTSAGEAALTLYRGSKGTERKIFDTVDEAKSYAEAIAALEGKR